MPASSTVPVPAAPANQRPNAWPVVEWLLLCAWVLDAALVMTHKRAGFLTEHAADLALPAWLYVSFRRHRDAATSRWRRALGGLHPLRLAAAFFLASTATEVSQLSWPRGLFPGTFDAADIVAYGTGLLACCLADLRWPIPPRARGRKAGSGG